MDIQTQKLNWIFNGRPQEIKGICERYQQNLDNVSKNAQTRINYSKKALAKTVNHIEKLKHACIYQQHRMEALIEEFSQDTENNIWISDDLMKFNGFSFLTENRGFVGQSPKLTKEMEPYYYKAQPILQEIDNFVILLCELKKANMLYDYITVDKNINLSSAKQFQKEYKLAYSKVPFIKSEYSSIYKSIFKNLDRYVANLDLFAVKSFEESSVGKNIKREVELPAVKEQEQSVNY